MVEAAASGRGGRRGGEDVWVAGKRAGAQSYSSKARKLEAARVHEHPSKGHLGPQARKLGFVVMDTVMSFRSSGPRLEQRERERERERKKKKEKK